MKGIEPGVLESLVNLSYGAEIEINTENSDQLLFGADFLQLYDLKKDFGELLMTHLKPDNVIKIKHAAMKLDCVELVEAAEEFIDNNFPEFCSTDDYLELDSQELISIIKRDELTVTEEIVYEAVLKWIKNAAEERVSLLPEILSNVRLSLLSPEYLFNVVRKEHLVKTSHDCRDLLEEAMGHNMRTDVKELPKNIRNRPRNSNGLIYVLGGLNSPRIQAYDLREDKWAYVENLQKIERYCAATVFELKLYTFGGLYLIFYSL